MCSLLILVHLRKDRRLRLGCTQMLWLACIGSSSGNMEVVFAEVQFKYSTVSWQCESN